MAKYYISGNNQTRTATPSNIQQTITPEPGFNALDAVVVNPIKAVMPQTLEQYIMRDDNIEPFSLNLDGAVPSYACYGQNNLVAVYGSPTYIGQYAFESCLRLETIDCRNVNSLGMQAFHYCNSLLTLDLRNVTVFSALSANSCALLKAVDCRNAMQFNNQCLRYCPHLFLVDISNSHNATLSGVNDIQNNNNLTILVANDADKTYYQSATNWSTLASKFKTVAEFEQQIGMSYDDYYEIIFGHPRFDTEEEQP